MKHTKPPTSLPVRLSARWAKVLDRSGVGDDRFRREWRYRVHAPILRREPTSTGNIRSERLTEGLQRWAMGAKQQEKPDPCTISPAVALAAVSVVLAAMWGALAWALYALNN
jgi:hypothetical protein